jgi:hypothetical protein
MTMKAAEQLRTANATVFPEAAIRNALNEFWNQHFKDRQEDPFNPAPKPKGTIHDLLPILDSLTVARSFNVISKVLKVKIPINLVKKGGYDSRDNMFDDLLPQLQKLYNKRSALTTSTK